MLTIGYLKGFDIANMVHYVDFFNFMAYDIHGTWDGRTSKWTKSVVNPHTNLTGTYDALVLNIIGAIIARAKLMVRFQRLLLVLTFYGATKSIPARSYWASVSTADPFNWPTLHAALQDAHSTRDMAAVEALWLVNVVEPAVSSRTMR